MPRPYLTPSGSPLLPVLLQSVFLCPALHLPASTVSLRVPKATLATWKPRDATTQAACAQLLNFNNHKRGWQDMEKIKNRELLLVTGQVFIGVVTTACENYLSA